jgi:methylglutaconyl-CoA hydratase
MAHQGDEESELVHHEVVEGVATITLDSPHNRNALSKRLVAQLAAHLRDAWEDPTVRGVVLTGSGTTFCSGADLREPPDTPAASGEITVPQVLDEIWHSPKTLVLRLNGHVRAGGIGLVAAADVVVAPRSATFAFTEVRIGVVPAIVAVLCARRMQPRPLAELMLTGEPFDASRARDAGLITTVVDDDALDAAVEHTLAGVRLAEPTAVRITKDLLVRLPTLSVAEGFALTEHISQDRFRSPEAAEGIAAFREKRPPSWVPSR